MNLSPEEGYRVAKGTLSENFGKPHVIARAHIKKLVDLPNLKKADGLSLLEFARHLDSRHLDRSDVKGNGSGIRQRFEPYEHSKGTQSEAAYLPESQVDRRSWQNL